jgi:hypothetical protein
MVELVAFWSAVLAGERTRQMAMEDEGSNQL